jgi:hypothetical protein
MTALEALAILEAATLECKKREADTAELRAGLDFLEPHIQPAWLIAQFRHNLDGEREHEYAAREGQQQVFRVTFPGIRNSVRAVIGKQADSLARKFHETHDMAVKDELERLLKEYGELGKPWSSWCVEIDAKIEEAER